MFIFPDMLCLFDVETTDVNVGPPRIIEIAGILVDRHGEELDSFHSLVHPKHLSLVTTFTTELTGLEPTTLESAKQWVEIWPDWAKFTRYNRTVLAAWGTTFDVLALKGQYARCGLGYPHNERSFDLLTFAQTVCGWAGVNPQSWKLAHVCERFNIEGGKHRAMDDVLRMSHLVRKLIAVIDADGDASVINS